MADTTAGQQVDDADLLDPPLPEGQTLDTEVVPGVTVRDVRRFHRGLPTPSGWTFCSGVVYGTAGRNGRPLTLDLYAPDLPRPRRPAVVFVHGGAWHHGGPGAHLRAAGALAHRGYVTAMITYRLAGEATWPAALEDCKGAVRWLRANADTLGVDPDRIAIAGDSAGGHLAAMVALVPGEFEGEGGNPDVPSEVAAVATWFPMVDLDIPEPAYPGSRALVHSFLGSDRPEVAAQASPVHHVHPGCPPVLTMTGEQDPVALVDAITSFHARLDEAGVENELAVWPDRGHGFSFLPSEWEATFDRLYAFLDRHLSGPVHSG